MSRICDEASFSSVKLRVSIGKIVEKDSRVCVMLNCKLEMAVWGHKR
jgi:hypothetical protein